MTKRYQLTTFFLSCYLLMVCFADISFTQVEVSIPASKDNTLYEDATGSLSNGAGSHFFVGTRGQEPINRRRGLLAFDVASNVPAGATIQSVTLTLSMSRTSTGDQNVSLHRVLADWGEGTSDAPGGEGVGASSTTGDATWIHRFFDTDLWTTPGGDFSTTVSDSQLVGANGIYTWGSTAEMVADIQGWLDNPSENFGWILIGNESTFGTSKRFDTKEDATESNHPVLTVTFLPTSVEDKKDGVPTQFSLAQNYPNPFNPTTTITYALKENTQVILKIYNARGQEIRTLVNENQTAGFKSVVWDGKNSAGQPVTSGIYFYTMAAKDFVESHKMIFLK